MKPRVESKAGKRRQPMVGTDGEVRELDLVDIAAFRPAREALPPELHEQLLTMNRRAGVRGAHEKSQGSPKISCSPRGAGHAGPGPGGAQKAPTKERITIRLSPEVVSRFRASGPGWQGRLDEALKDWLQNHSPA